MTVQPVPAARHLSASSIASLICGILGCIPFVTGILAIVLGIVGLFRTANPLRRGRWMAVVGLVLGLISVGVWTVSSGAIMAKAYAAFKGIIAPAEATHDFIKALSDGDVASAQSHSVGISDETLKKMSADVRGHGTFIDSTMNNVNWNNGSVAISGTARFGSGTQDVSANLEKVDDKWKVTQLTISGPESTTGP